jgi:plastocyanin
VRRLAPAAVLALALVAPATAKPPPPAVSLQVAAREFSFVLSQEQVTEGNNAIELVNFGQDPHNLVVRRLGSTATLQSILVAPGHRAQLLVKLRRGTYELYCSLLDHQSLGMDTTIDVKSRKSR